MNLAALASVILAICKAVPAAAQLAEMVGAQLAEGRRAKAHAANEADRLRITSSPWVCPRTCPHRGLHGTEQSAAPEGNA
jgi:hypothetical protein